MKRVIQSAKTSSEMVGDQYNWCSKVDYLLLLEVGTPLKRVHEEDYTSGVWLSMILCGSEAGDIKSCDGC